MSLQIWLPLNETISNQGLSECTLSGTPKYKEGKTSSKALDLSSRITGNCPSLSGKTTWSLTFWAKTEDDTTLTTDWVDIISLYDQKADNTTNGDFRFETCYGAAKSVGVGYYNNGTLATITVNGGTIVGPKGTWNHYAVITNKEDNSVKVYLNGNLYATKVHAGGHLRGGFHIGETSKVKGAIQDIRIYDHAISIKELKEICKGLAIHLPLNWGGNPNLIQGVHTRAVSGSGGTFTREVLSDDKGSYIRLTCTTAGYGPYWGGFGKTDPDGTTRVGRKFTWSCTMRSSKATTRNAGHECGGLKDIALTTEWKNYSHTWTMTDGTYVAWRIYNNYAVGDWFEIRDLKIEECDIATPWTPNSNDTAQYVIYNTNVCADDCGGYKRNATITNCLPDASCPRYSTAIKVSTTSDKIVLAPSLSSGQTLTEFTTAIWAKTNTLNSTAPNIVSLGQNSFWRFRIQSATAVWYYIRVGSTQVQSTYTTKTLTDNIWHHYALTFKDGIVRLYIDGAQVGTTDHSATAKYITCASTNWILHSYDGTNEAFVGSLSDCRIYHTCLSADDIKRLYDTPIAIDNTGKVFCNNLIDFDNTSLTKSGNVKGNLDEDTTKAKIYNTGKICATSFIEV